MESRNGVMVRINEVESTKCEIIPSPRIYSFHVSQPITSKRSNLTPSVETEIAGIRFVHPWCI